MERIILAALRWDTAAVTPQDFLPHLLASLEDRGESERELLSTLRRHSDTLAALCVCDSRFLGAPPSLVAAASLNCALRGLGSKESAQLAVVSEMLAELCQTDLVRATSSAGSRPCSWIAKVIFSHVLLFRQCCSATVR